MIGAGIEGVANTGAAINPECRNPGYAQKRPSMALSAGLIGAPTIAERRSPWGRWRGGARLFGPRGGAAWPV